MLIKILSWNIWQGHHLEKIILFLKTSNADIIGLEEVIEKDGTNTAEIIAKALRYNFIYYRAIDKTRLGFPQGNAILSKFPITQSTKCMLSDISDYKNTAETEPRVAVKAKITIANKELTVCVTHLAYSHMFKNSKTRNKQVNNLTRLLPSKKTILMGDFNSHPNSLYI